MKANLPPIFMPRNEEEIMRTVIALDAQLKYVDDKQQVTITFDEQTERHLYFTVIVVRIVKEAESIASKMQHSSFLQYLHDRTRNMGFLRKKYPKTATIFRVKFAKDPFFKKDGSIDIYKAREALAGELVRLIGNFRDYNGGILKKQKLLLETIKHGRVEDDFLEPFFYSLVPACMRPMLDPEAFITLYNMLWQDEGMHYDGQFTYLMMKSEDRRSLEETAFNLFEKFQNGTDLVQGYIKIGDKYCMGYIYLGPDHDAFQDYIPRSYSKLILSYS